MKTADMKKLHHCHPMYIKLTFVVVSHKIFLARLFCAPLPAAPGRNCPLSYATGEHCLLDHERESHQPCTVMAN